MRTGARIGARTGGNASCAALFAILALLVQALLPAAALAAQSAGGAQVEICTSAGAKTFVIGVDGKVHKTFMGLPCQDCLSVTLAMTATPELAVAPIAYAAARVRHSLAVEQGFAVARAPPRPPSQGPPARIV